MTSKHAFYTKTMGDLYFVQGYYEDARRIFKTLLEKDPGRTDCLSALSLCEERIRVSKNPSPDDLGSLILCWAELLKKEQRLKNPSGAVRL
jgi:hypothetical protein